MKDAKDYRGFDFLFLTGKFNVNNGAFRVVETDLVELRLESKYKLSQVWNIGKIVQFEMTHYAKSPHFVQKIDKKLKI